MIYKYFTYSILFTCVVFTSCADDLKTREELDTELRELLLTNSETGDIDFYQFPASTDYRNIPQDPNNRLTKAKVELGKNLFHETAFGTNNTFPITAKEYSCATCHHASAGFQAGIAQGIGEGGEGFGLLGESRVRNVLCEPEMCDIQPIRTPTAINGAFQPVMLWNGQFGATDLNTGTEQHWTAGTPKEVNHLGFEGLETQAIAGLDVHRIVVDRPSVEENGYKAMFDQAFPTIDASERYTNTTAGLAIAAYERTMMAYNAPWQKYLRGNQLALSTHQKEGAILFFGKANCVSCHTGPALNKMEFHALGMNEFDPNAVTFYNPEDPTRFGRYSFTKVEEDKFKFKTPQLYNLRNVNFYGHGSSFTSVKEVIEYKNQGLAQNPEVPQSQLAEEFQPLGLTNDEVQKITDFINFSLHDPNLERFVPQELPSGACFPNADVVSMRDLGCE